MTAETDASTVDHDILFHLNLVLDRLAPGYDTHEKGIEGLVGILDNVADCRLPEYWLTMARITELVLICAGRYADQCEFQAAGDLLVNPRKLLIHHRDRSGPTVKVRHGSLSEQMQGAGVSRQGFVRRFRFDFCIETVQQALLPFLTARLAASTFMAPRYIEDVRTRMARVSDAIGFLSSGGIKSGEALALRLGTASPETRRFIEAHLCRFGDDRFKELGRLVVRTGDAGGFLAPFPAGISITKKWAMS